MSRHKRFYRPELDVLRCLAFLAVFLHHSALFTHGWLLNVRLGAGFGLCVFFFLSAFLITELLDREQESTGTVRLGAFYARRILRIWPLYFSAVLLDFLYMNLRQPGTFTRGHLAAFALLGGNVFVAHHGWIGLLSFPLWSISVEEQFYLLWPSMRRYSGRIGAIYFSSFALLVSYGALFILCRQQTNVETSIWVNSFVQFQFFATGALLALLLRGRTPDLQPWLRLLLLSGGLTAFYMAQTIFRVKAGMPVAEFRLLAPGYLLVNAGCIALFLSLLGLSELSRATPLVYLGKISYGLYVFHYGMLVLCSRILRPVLFRAPQLNTHFLAVRAVVSFACTVPLAAVSYRYFEQPILRFKQRFEVIHTRPV